MKFLSVIVLLSSLSVCSRSTETPGADSIMTPRSRGRDDRDGQQCSQNPPIPTALKVLGLLVLGLSGGCGGRQVPSVDPTRPVTVYRGDRQPAPACPTQQEASSPEQFRDLAQRAVDRMETCRSGIARNLQRTRDSGDIIAVLCISDKLSRFDALLKQAHERQRELEEAATGQAGAWTKTDTSSLLVVCQRSYVLVTDARDCRSNGD